MAMPAISSGELFFRTKGQARGSWLHGSLGEELRSFLGVGTAEVNDKNFFSQKKMLDEAEELSLNCHKSMCRTLELHTIKAEQLCKSFLSRAKTTDSAFRQSQSDLVHEYDDKCGRLALWYYSALEREQEIYRRRMEEESLSCNRLSMQVKESLRLSVFAIHLESETDSQILLKRLPQTHPQHVRCRRAASENIKPGYFDEAAPFTGINVLDVYKVENAPELERFQKRAAAMEPGKVKGLFTSVQGSAIERIIALGMGGSAGDQHIFRRAWYAYHNNKSEVGYAENKVRKSDLCQFPRSFSRYSTLEADVNHIERAAELERLGNSNSSKNSKDNDNKEGKDGKNKGTAADGGGELNENIRYLVLCRVAVGKVFVTSKEYKGFPSVGTDPAFDSMYNPLQEEYLILRPRQVLPEFIIQSAVKRNPGATAVPTTTKNPPNEIPVIPIDLSSPHVVLPKDDTTWRLNIATKGSGKEDASVLNLVAPTATNTPRPTIATAWSSNNNNNNDGQDTSTSSSISPAVRAAEITRREQLTSWEQLRLNAARQRESILEKAQGLSDTYRRFNTKLRVSL